VEERFLRRVLRCRDGSCFDKVAAQLRGSFLIPGKLASDLCALKELISTPVTRRSPTRGR